MFHCLLLSLTLCQMIKDKPVAAMTGAHAALASYDWIQTRVDVSHGWIETDPLARPFVHTTGVLAAAGVVEVLGTSYVAEKMKHSRHPFLRRTWFVPQAVAIGAHLGCAIYGTSQ